MGGVVKEYTFIDLNVQGDIEVTGTVDGVDVSAHAADTDLHHIHGNFANLALVDQNVGTTGSPVYKGLAVDGDIAVAGKVDGVDISAHVTDTSIHSIATNKIYLDSIDQNLGKINAPAFAGLTINGDIAAKGVVDGINISAHTGNNAIHHLHSNKEILDGLNQKLEATAAPTFVGLTVNGDVAVTGKVDGVDVSAHAGDTSIHHTHANRAILDAVNQNVGTTGSPSFASLMVAGDIKVIGEVDGVDISGHAADAIIHHSHSNKANLDSVNQNLGTADAPAFAGLTVKGNVAVTGTVDGVDISSHATRHQTGGTDPLIGSLDANARVQVMFDNNLVGTRRALNLISGGNVNLAVVDNAAKESVDVTISVVGTSSTITGLETDIGVAGEALEAFHLCYLGGDGKYYKANSLSPDTMPGLVLAAADLKADQEGTFILRGQVINSGWSWTSVGSFIYACGNYGVMTQFLPDIPGEQVQIIGIAKSATQIYFNPQLSAARIP